MQPTLIEKEGKFYIETDDVFVACQDKEEAELMIDNWFEEEEKQ